MADYDCDDCKKRELCTQDFSYTCPFHKIKYGVKYENVLKEVSKKLMQCFEIIKESEKEPYDLEFLYERILSINKDILDDYLDEELLVECKKLFKI